MPMPTAHSDYARIQQRVADAERDKEAADIKIAVTIAKAESKQTEAVLATIQLATVPEVPNPVGFFRHFETAVGQQYASALAFLPALRAMVEEQDKVTAANAQAQASAAQQAIIDQLAANSAVIAGGHIPQSGGTAAISGAQAATQQPAAASGKGSGAPEESGKTQKTIIDSRKTLNEVIKPDHRLNHKTKVDMMAKKTSTTVQRGFRGSDATVGPRSYTSASNFWRKKWPAIPTIRLHPFYGYAEYQINLCALSLSRPSASQFSTARRRAPRYGFFSQPRQTWFFCRNTIWQTRLASAKQRMLAARWDGSYTSSQQQWNMPTRTAGAKAREAVPRWRSGKYTYHGKSTAKEEEPWSTSTRN